MAKKEQLQQPQMAQQPNISPIMGDDLNRRAATEMAMLQKADQKKQMEAQAPKKIGEAEVLKATETLRKYKEGKLRLEKKLIADEEFWKLRQWRMIHNDEQDFNPASAWLWSCIQSRYADVMDSYPTCNFQPRQKDDIAEAKKLSSIVPVILEQNRYEDVYSDVAWYTLKHGGSVQGIFWNGSKHNGLGDIEIKQIDFINLFWESGIKNIQESQNVFMTELVDNNILEQRYPQTKGKLNTKTIELAKYIYDDQIDTSEKSCVIDWYYHTEYNGKRQLQYVKYVNDIVLYATENETEVPTTQKFDPETGLPLIIQTGESVAMKGLYDHAQYPFVVMDLYPIEGSLCGYGLTDIGRDTQLVIDRINKAFIDNAIAGATPRTYISSTTNVNIDEYRDLTNKLVHVEGSLDDMHMQKEEVGYLPTQYINFLNSKIDELKYITSNQDVANGQAPSGVTAASAIAALQESSGKAARSSNKTFHRAFREVCYQIVELIRQFYDLPRTFRIVPDATIGAQFTDYSNAGLVPQQQFGMDGEDMGFRLPEFDIDVTSEKANPYKKMEMNELALSFYNNGFYNPQMADQALAALEMMDFTKKDDVMQKIKENGTIYETMLRYQQLALQLAQNTDPALADQLGQMILAENNQNVPTTVVASTDLDGSDENPMVERARNQARSSTQVE